MKFKKWSKAKPRSNRLFENRFGKKIARLLPKNLRFWAENLRKPKTTYLYQTMFIFFENSAE